MIYIKKFTFPDQETETSHLIRNVGATYYESSYPFKFLSLKGLESLDFTDITILAGGNGSGKSTALNIIAEHLELSRESLFNKTELFEDYLNYTSGQVEIYDPNQMQSFMAVSRIITSDDVFKHILSLRKKNDDIAFKRDILRNGHKKIFIPAPESNEVHFDDPGSVQRFIDSKDMLTMGYTKFVKSRNLLNERTYSNGETGYRYFLDAIQPGGLYLLDEPENSMSAQMQAEFAGYIFSMARFYDCQFIISSHSPFFLAIPSAKIYDMDANPIAPVKWTDLPNIRAYHNFFRQHEEDFE